MRILSFFYRFIKIFFVWVSIITGFLIFLRSFSYYSPDFSSGYLYNKEVIFSGLFGYGFYAHIVSAPVILLIGFILLNDVLRKRLLKVHRFLGYLYVILLLFLASPGGLVMSFYAFGGILSTINFVLLTLLWWLFTYVGYKKIRLGDFLSHKMYMERSMILTLSAVLFRLYSFLGAKFGYSGENFYVVAVYMSWLPNILSYEFLRIYKSWRFRLKK